MSSNWNAIEYESLRREGVTRIRFLHQTLVSAVVLQAALLAFGYILFLNKVDLVLYLLLIPIFTNFLAFNYQSNQMSLEAISKYIHESLAPHVRSQSKDASLDWDRYFSAHKGYYKFEAFFKVLPLIFPNLIPIVLLVIKAPMTGWEIVLLVVDFILLAIMVENFRYKLRRVK